MKCFIHASKEAVAVCRKCGKAMCDDCSSYSGHSGICPECRKKEFEAEVVQNEGMRKKLKWEMIKGVAVTVLLCWTVIGLFVGIYRFIKRKHSREALTARNVTLREEIKRLNEVLSRVGGAAFI